MAEERVLWDAELNERVTTYWLLNGAIILTVSSWTVTPVLWDRLVIVILCLAVTRCCVTIRQANGLHNVLFSREVE